MKSKHKTQNLLSNSHFFPGSDSLLCSLTLPRTMQTGTVGWGRGAVVPAYFLCYFFSSHIFPLLQYEVLPTGDSPSHIAPVWVPHRPQIMTENLFILWAPLYVHACSHHGMHHFSGYIHLLQHGLLCGLECWDFLLQRLWGNLCSAACSTSFFYFSDHGICRVLPYIFLAPVSQLLCRVFTFSWIRSCSSATSPTVRLSCVLWWVRWSGLALAVFIPTGGHPCNAPANKTLPHKPSALWQSLCLDLASTSNFTNT